MDTRRTKPKDQWPRGTKAHGQNIQIKFKLTGEKGYTYKTLPWSHTPANIERAGRLRQDITHAIKYNTFRWSDFFPDDPRATQRNTGTFHDHTQSWLDNPENDWKPQTRYKFKGILQRVWMPALFDRPIDQITYKHLLDALINAMDEFKAKNQREPAPSLYNDWLACLRGVFDQAVKSGDLKKLENPAAEFSNKKRPKTEPDPFDPDEANAIIDNITQHDGPLWGAWFELGFYTGMRYPSEPAALHWHAIDLKKGEAIINQIYSKHAPNNIQKTTKTGVARTIILNSRAQHALNTCRKITGFQDKFVFLQDTTKRDNNGNLKKIQIPVTTGDPQRAMWRAAIKRLNIRYRDPYNMRHTYATIGLMAGANPAFMANQLGHSVEEFFKTYAKWINRMNNNIQMELIEQGIKQNGAKTGQKNSELS